MYIRLKNKAAGLFHNGSIHPRRSFKFVEFFSASTYSSLLLNTTETETEVKEAIIMIYIDNETKSKVSLINKIKSSTASDKLAFRGHGKALHSKEVTGTESKKVVGQIPDSSCTPPEKVFNADHILESIFQELDTKTLLNCRLVSRRSATFASQALQKIINIKFIDSEFNTENFDDDMKPSNYENESCLDQNRFVRDLITLMPLMSNSTQFPSTSFSFWGRNGSSLSRAAQPFLSAHGHWIKKLEFKGDIFLDDLKRLLLTQVPNLEQLSLNFLEILYDKSDRNKSLENRQNVSKAANNKHAKQMQSLFDDTISGPNPQPILKNLKIFQCNSQKAEIVIQQILDCSPNLLQVSLSDEYLHCLVQPKNRVHLIKELGIDIQIEKNNINSLQFMANHHGDNLALEEIHFFGCPKVDNDLHSIVVDVMTKILKGSSTTCKRLLWHEVIKDFKIPLMPRVRHLTFYYAVDHETDLPIPIFSGGANFQDTFPNLKYLTILSFYDMENVTVENIFGYAQDYDVPVPSVRNVVLNFEPDQNLVQNLIEMFPNAIIDIDIDMDVESENDNEGNMT